MNKRNIILLIVIVIIFTAVSFWMNRAGEEVVINYNDETGATIDLTYTENDTSDFFGEEAEWGNSSIDLHDIHGLWGGIDVSISDNGQVYLQHVKLNNKEGKHYIKTYKFTLTESELKSIIVEFIKNDFLNIKTKDRFGVPDEAQPNIRVKQGDKVVNIKKWQNDENEEFTNIYQEFYSLFERTKDMKPIEDGLWEYSF